MAGIDFHALTHADPVPTLLLHSDGWVLAANPAAREAFPGISAQGGLNLADICIDSPAKIRAYLERCSTTRDGVLGALTLRTSSGEPARFRCDGALVQPAGIDAPAVLVLRCRDVETAHERFAALTGKIAELHAEIHLRTMTQRHLETVLAEKDVLLKEVQHRVKNNLQVIAGMLLMATQQERDGKLRRTLTETSGRVQAMATVQRLLYQTGSLTELDASVLLPDLCESMHRSYGSGQFKLVVDAASVRIGLETATALALLVNELVANACQRVVSDGQPGTLTLSLAESSDRRLRLVLEDDGCGMERGGQASAGESSGLSEMLIQGLVTQLAADLQTQNRPEGSGTRTTVVFPADLSDPS